MVIYSYLLISLVVTMFASIAAWMLGYVIGFGGTEKLSRTYVLNRMSPPVDAQAIPKDQDGCCCSQYRGAIHCPACHTTCGDKYAYLIIPDVSPSGYPKPIVELSLDAAIHTAMHLKAQIAAVPIITTWKYMTDMPIAPIENRDRWVSDGYALGTRTGGGSEGSEDYSRA